jgi:flagellar biogenesis protein FliO
MPLNLWSRLRFGLNGLQEKLRARSTKLLRVRETLAIGEKRQLLIVQCGEKRLLIGAAGNCLTMLAELAPSDKHEGETA